MNEPGKSIWTRRYSLPNLVPFVAKVLRLVSPLFRPKMLLRYFFFVACVATLIALFYAEEDLRGKHAWESYMRQSKAKGIELDWRAYIPPPVPDEQNFAMTPPFDGFFDYERTTNDVHWRDTNIWLRLQWLSFNSPKPPELGDWRQGRPLDLKQWQAYFRSVASPRVKHKPAQSAHDVLAQSLFYWPIPAEPEEPAHDVLLALSKFDPDLAALRKASARPQSRFPIHYDELAGTELLHPIFLDNVCEVLQLRAVAALESGLNQQAFDDVNLAFYCADAIKSDALIVSQMVRCRMMEVDLQPIWEGLRAHRWSDDQLKEFQRYFSKTDLLSQYVQSVKADIAFTCGWFESMADDPSAFAMVMEDSGRHTTGAAGAAMELRLLPRGWYYQNELSAARFFHENYLPDVAPQTQRVHPGLSRTNAALFDKLPDTPYNFAFKLFGSVALFGSVVSPQGFVHTQTEINLALVACALERYRLAHDHFPETLNALAPEFLVVLPHDIINGEPLKYRLTDPGRFILYSVGWNEKDDGGTYPGPKAPSNQGFRNLFNYHPETGDWVWQYPE